MKKTIFDLTDMELLELGVWGLDCPSGENTWSLHRDPKRLSVSCMFDDGDGCTFHIYPNLNIETSEGWGLHNQHQIHSHLIAWGIEPSKL